MPEAFDGIDVIILASNRLANDPIARQAIRRRVQQGGALGVARSGRSRGGCALIGEGCDFTIVDRVRLEAIRSHHLADPPSAAETRNVDDPIEMVRVALGPSNTAIHLVNGWPSSFVQRVGRGQVIFTTLAPRGWYQPRTSCDPRALFEHFPNHPLPLNHLAEIALRLHPWRDRQSQPQVSLDALHDMAVQEIGYSIVGRGTVVGIFVGFFLAVLGLGAILRRWRRAELIGWLTPGPCARCRGRVRGDWRVFGRWCRPPSGSRR